MLCSGCAERSQCQQCNKTKCEGCLHTCDGCKRIRCDDCVSFRCCSVCKKKHCVQCFDGKEYNVSFCDDCEEEVCVDCHLGEYKTNGARNCNTCNAFMLSIILKENAKLSEENEELREKAAKATEAKEAAEAKLELLTRV